MGLTLQLARKRNLLELLDDACVCLTQKLTVTNNNMYITRSTASPLLLNMNK